MKNKLVGDTIIIEISRIVQSFELPNKNEDEILTKNKVSFNEENFNNDFDDVLKELNKFMLEDIRELLKLNIPLNDSPSAGIIIY